MNFNYKTTPNVRTIRKLLQPLNRQAKDCWMWNDVWEDGISRRIKVSIDNIGDTACAEMKVSLEKMFPTYDVSVRDGFRLSKTGSGFKFQYIYFHFKPKTTQE